MECSLRMTPYTQNERYPNQQVSINPLLDNSADNMIAYSNTWSLIYWSSPIASKPTVKCFFEKVW